MRFDSIYHSFFFVFCFKIVIMAVKAREVGITPKQNTKRVVVAAVVLLALKPLSGL
jgi:hypothetical protein